MELIDKVSNFFEKICKYFLTVAFAIMTIVTLVEVIRRYIFGLSYPWAEELVRFLLIWTTFIGGSIAFKKGGLVYLDLLQKRLSQKLSIWVQLFNSLFILVFLIIIFILSWNYTFSNSIMLQTSTGLNLPMAVPYFSIPLGFFFMIFFCINNLFSTFKKARGRKV